MSYVAFFCCLAVIIIMVTTKKSGYSIAFTTMFLAIAVMMVCGILCKIAFSNYEILFGIEIPFYKYLRRVNMSYYEIKKLAVASMLIFFCGLNMISLSSKSEHYSIKKKVINLSLNFILMLIYFVLNSNNFCEQIFLWHYFGGMKARIAQISTYTVRAYDCVMMLGSYAIPAKKLMDDYCSTDLLLRKKQLSLMLACLALIGIISAFAIFNLPIFHILYSLNIYNFYDNVLAGDSFNTFFVIGIIIVLIVINVLLIRYRVFDVYNIFRRKSKKNASIAIRDLRHIFHTIKNYAMVIIVLQKKALKEANENGRTVNLEKIGATAVALINQCGNFLDICSDINLKEDRINLLECVNEAAANLSQDNIDISICVDTDKLHIYGNKSIITEMCVNIIQNAVDAIKIAGREQGRILIRLFSEHSIVCISFLDNGCGLKRASIKGALKPFVSSKRTFDHWGIGLSYVSNAVSLHSGYLNIRSKKGEFTEIQTAFNFDSEVR